MDSEGPPKKMGIYRRFEVSVKFFNAAIPCLVPLVCQFLVVFEWLRQMQMHWPCSWSDTGGEASCETYCDFYGTKWVCVFVLALALALHSGVKWTTATSKSWHQNYLCKKLGLLVVILLGWWWLSYMTSLWSTLLWMVILLLVVAYAKAVTLEPSWPHDGHFFLMVQTIAHCLFLTCVVSVFVGYHASAEFQVTICLEKFKHDQSLSSLKQKQLLGPDRKEFWFQPDQQCLIGNATLPSACHFTQTPSLFFAGSHAWTHQMDSFHWFAEICTPWAIGAATSLVCYVTNTITFWDAVTVFCFVFVYPFFTGVRESHDLVGLQDPNVHETCFDNVNPVQRTGVVFDVFCVVFSLFCMGCTYYDFFDESDPATDYDYVSAADDSAENELSSTFESLDISRIA